MQVRWPVCLPTIRSDLLDLLREFARGGDDQRAWRTRAHADALHERERERGGLSGAGLSGGDDIPPGQNQFD